MTTSQSTLADLVAEVVLGHPDVVRLDAGKFGPIASPLPGRKVIGVRASEAGDPVEIAVVLRLTKPLTEIATELRTRVQTVAGAVPVDIVISDVVVGEPEGSGPTNTGGQDAGA